MKKNTIMRIAAVVLMCTLVTACFASSTFARYTSQATSAADEATVARWSIQVGDNKDEIAVVGDNANITFDVFNTAITDTGFATESDVSSGKIAPGTTGQFKIEKIHNNSEVTANIVVKVDSVTNVDKIPLKFYKDQAMTQPIDLKAGTELVNEDVAIDGDVTATTIYWAWDYAGSDVARSASDTALGIAAQGKAPTYGVALTIVATQVD